MRQHTGWVRRVYIAVTHQIGFLGSVVLLSIFSAFLPITFLMGLFSVTVSIVNNVLGSDAIIAPGVFLHRAPILEWLALLLAGLITAGLIRQAITPIKPALRRLAQSRVTRTTSSPLSCYSDQLARRVNIRPPKVFISETPGISAFVVARPLRRPCLVLSRGVLALPEPVGQWIVAHEIGHLFHGDAQRNYAWWRFLDATLALHGLRQRVTITAVNLLLWLPLLGGWLQRFAIGTERLFQRLLRIGTTLACLWFELFTRASSRQMEFRADRFAVDQAGADAGIWLFTSLSTGHFEPIMMTRLWRTHPSLKERIHALHRYH